MTEGNFTDYVKVYVRSGNGGKGSTHLHREKFVEKGGPDGGDGGRGGDIIIRGNKNLWTLINFKFQQHFRAEHGGDGGANRSTGADGNSVYLEVPLGTIVKDALTDEVLFEITEDKEEKIALKVLADVGLVGFPNAGKSTLLSVLTSAKPKIADYPFTTLKPNLGIVRYRDFQSFVIADIPGIIEGASQGKGLGHYFLRHIERNSVLLFLVPADSPNIVEEYHILLKELEKYNPELLDKQRLLAISKTDLLDQELQGLIEKELQAASLDLPYLLISSVAQQGITILKDRLWQLLQ